MEKRAGQKLFTLIFLPALLLSVLLAGSSVLFRLFKQILIGQLSNPFQIISSQIINNFSTNHSCANATVVAKYHPFEKVVRGTLIALIGIISSCWMPIFSRASSIECPIQNTS